MIAFQFFKQLAKEKFYGQAKAPNLQFTNKSFS